MVTVFSKRLASVSRGSSPQLNFDFVSEVDPEPEPELEPEPSEWTSAGGMAVFEVTRGPRPGG
jgi:hypothetical protein